MKQVPLMSAGIRPVRIARMAVEALDICSFELADPAGVPLPAFTAGSHIEAAGVALQTSCEQGVCGTCLTRVLEGIPDHRDLYLTPQEQERGDQFTPCCSRAKSARLVLDL